LTALIAENESAVEIGMNSEGKIFVAGENLFENALFSQKQINDGKWHFVALQRDSAGYHLFVDDLQPAASAKGTAAILNEFSVGFGYQGNNPFSGAIDEVKLFDTAIETASFQRSYAPLPPEKLSYTSNALNVRLTWTDPADNEEGFVIHRKEADGEWMEIGTVGTNKFIFNDELDNYETEYSYRVMSFTSAGNSFPSNVVTYTTPADPATSITVFEGHHNWKIYPNPANQTLVIETDPFVSIQVTDLNGRVVLQKEHCAQLETFDVSGLLNGLYVVHIATPTEITHVKLMKN